MNNDDSGILDISDLATLQVADAARQVADFEKTWRLSPSAVAIPILTQGGIPFENDFLESQTVKYKGEAGKAYLGDIVRRFGALNKNIYLLLVPSLGFVRSDTLHIRSIVGSSSAQACFCKDATVRFLEHTVERALLISHEACEEVSKGSSKQTQVEGLVIDLTDILPMSAKNERLKLNCFCQECRDQLAEYSPRGSRLIRAFEDFPNPWNLALRDDGTGIGFMQDFGWDVTPEAIIGLSKVRGFADIFKDTPSIDLEDMAGVLIDYLHARHLQIRAALERLFNTARACAAKIGITSLRRIIVNEGFPYNWTAGVFLDRLDDPALCDELWFDPSSAALSTKHVNFRSYMWTRSRYFINSFFQFFHNVQDADLRTMTGLARLDVPSLTNMLELRRRQALSGRLASLLDLFLLPEPKEGPGRVGFVSPSLTDDLSQAITSRAKVAESFLQQEARLHSVPPQGSGDIRRLIDLYKKLKKDE